MLLRRNKKQDMASKIDKKGQGLPLNTVIIAILVLVVLVVIIAFFVGGTSTIVTKISGIFGGATAGEDISLARNFCENYCEQALEMDVNRQQSSAFCTKFFKLDSSDADDKADKFTAEEGEDLAGEYKHFYCDGQQHQIDALAADSDLIGVSCNVQC